MIRCLGFQGPGENRYSGFELSSYRKFALGKAVLERGSPVHEDGPKEVSCVVVFTVTDLMGSLVVGPPRGSAHRCIVTSLPACPACC